MFPKYWNLIFGKFVSQKLVKSGTPERILSIAPSSVSCQLTDKMIGMTVTYKTDKWELM